MEKAKKFSALLFITHQKEDLHISLFLRDQCHPIVLRRLTGVNKLPRVHMAQLVKIYGFT